MNRLRHRALEGNMTMSICGLDYLYGDPTVTLDRHTTTYDWRKVTCRKCLRDKICYEPEGDA